MGSSSPLERKIKYNWLNYIQWTLFFDQPDATSHACEIVSERLKRSLCGYTRMGADITDITIPQTPHKMLFINQNL